MMTTLEKSILATLVYYDVLERPLTGFEIFKYLANLHKFTPLESHRFLTGFTTNSTNIRFFDILETLENGQALQKMIDQKNGFYFLKGRQGIVEQRIVRQKIADKKWKKIRRIINFLPMIPYIRMVAVSGSLAMNNPRPESDIDLLIVTRAGRIWTSRALTTLFIHLIGQRRHHLLTKDRICLNHYITNQSLEIPFKSLYNAQAYAHLVPVIEIEDGLYHQFQQANQWIKGYLKFWPELQRGYLKQVNPWLFFNFLRRLKELVLNGRIGDWLENFLRQIQMRRIQKDPLTYQAGGRVVFDDRQLEFHPDSPECSILDKYNKKMVELGWPELGAERDSGLLS